MSLDLTPKQMLYMDKLCQGWNAPQIAHKLKISHRTVETQMALARERNDVSTTLHLCVLWTAEKLKGVA